MSKMGIHFSSGWRESIIKVLEGGKFFTIGFHPSIEDSNIFDLKYMTNAGWSRFKNRSITARSIAGCGNVSDAGKN
jgi:hypothetical protein